MASNISNPTITSATTTTPFDFEVAENLFPNLINLINLSTLSNLNSTSNTFNSNQEDTETRSAKIEIGKNATAIRLNLASLKLQANQFKAGELSLEDQDKKIIELRKELKLKKIELAKIEFPISNTTESSSKSEVMETD